MGMWDKRFLDLADHVGDWSKDPRTKVGAVIVDQKKRVVSLGYNGFPRGVSDRVERYMDRETKHLFVSHAERNALDNASTQLDGCTMYAALKPCSECAKAIIQRGIKRVVTRRPDREDTGFNWDITDIMFREARIQIVYVD